MLLKLLLFDDEDAIEAVVVVFLKRFLFSIIMMRLLMKLIIKNIFMSGLLKLFAVARILSVCELQAGIWTILTW